MSTPPPPWPMPDRAAPADGRGFVYIAACSGPEDIIKVGMSHDPIVRWSAFHRRWFEAFDLEHSVLIQAETRRDARRLETSLHRRLRQHNCPAPMSMRGQFGGVTEWYRGAHDEALDFAREAAAQGHVVHAPARAWCAAAMQARTDTLAVVLDRARRDHADRLLSPAQREAVLDLIDAFQAFDQGVRERFEVELAALRTQGDG